MVVGDLHNLVRDEVGFICYIKIAKFLYYELPSYNELMVDLEWSACKITLPGNHMNN